MKKMMMTCLTVAFSLMAFSATVRAGSLSFGAGITDPAREIDLSHKGYPAKTGWVFALRYVPKWEQSESPRFWKWVDLGVEANGALHNNQGTNPATSISAGSGSIWGGDVLAKVSSRPGKTINPYAIGALGAHRTAISGGDLQFNWYWSAGVEFSRGRYFVAPEYREHNYELGPNHGHENLKSRQYMLFVGTRF